LSEQTTTKTLLPTVLLLLPSFQALQFQYIILILYNLDDYTRKQSISIFPGSGWYLTLQSHEDFCQYLEQK
jgi:hypothetical protein